jgi:hypothetical protein
MEQNMITRGLKPMLLRLDNEGSQFIKHYMYKKNISFQLVLPYCHHRNAEKRRIPRFKDHLIAGLRSINKSFPMHLWDRLLSHAVITLNMLMASRINPKLSALTHLDGQYDYNMLPMVPPCTISVAHETPSLRRNWLPRG